MLAVTSATLAGGLHRHPGATRLLRDVRAGCSRPGTPFGGALRGVLPVQGRETALAAAAAQRWGRSTRSRQSSTGTSPTRKAMSTRIEPGAFGEAGTDAARQREGRRVIGGLLLLVLLILIGSASVCRSAHLNAFDELLLPEFDRGRRDHRRAARERSRPRRQARHQGRRPDGVDRSSRLSRRASRPRLSRHRGLANGRLLAAVGPKADALGTLSADAAATHGELAHRDPERGRCAAHLDPCGGTGQAYAIVHVGNGPELCRAAGRRYPLGHRGRPRRLAPRHLRAPRLRHRPHHGRHRSSSSTGRSSGRPRANGRPARSIGGRPTKWPGCSAPSTTPAGGSWNASTASTRSWLA